MAADSRCRVFGRALLVRLAQQAGKPEKCGAKTGEVSANSRCDKLGDTLLYRLFLAQGGHNGGQRQAFLSARRNNGLFLASSRNHRLVYTIL